LIADANGAFYGTTVYGGRHDDGAVYKLTPKGSSGYAESILYSFKGGKDGANPAGRLIAGPTGTLYGTTTLGGDLSCDDVLGSGCGTVFALTLSGSVYAKRTLYRFKGYPNDGTQPDTLVTDASGTLYGSTSFGGGSGKCSTEGPGCGTVFRLSRSGRGYQESVLHSFNGRDGLNPTDGLLIDNAGALYGTTFFGGRKGKGAVYRLTPSKLGYAESILYSFKGSPDGYGPNGNLILDGAGTLYGTTLNGGAACGSGGCGTAFALRPSGLVYVETVLYSFQGGYDAAFPTGGLLAGKRGALFGNSGDGGGAYCDHAGCGTVYQLTPSGSTYTDRVLYAFEGGRRDGQIPLGTLLRERNRLYGATGYGGVRDNGTAFSVKP
jgi:uncharacterized repeat protein (TIGR03803 family)